MFQTNQAPKMFETLVTARRHPGWRHVRSSCLDLGLLLGSSLVKQQFHHRRNAPFGARLYPAIVFCARDRKVARGTI
jgi:hypothetical protein